jgi:MEMO1 family protein
MPIVHTSLFCHAPIVIPAVGGARGVACSDTTAAMRALAREVCASRPDAVVVISPHTPRLRERVPLVAGGLHVDFASFGADLAFSLPGIRDELALVAAARTAGLMLEGVRARTIDHGAGVPLAFLHEAGWRGPSVVVGLPWSDDLEEAERLGRALFAWSHGARIAVVASGDGSHRLKPGAPSGFHPDAQQFDQAVLERITASDDAGLSRLDADLRELAAEDILSSVVVATRAAGHARRRKVLSYEGPFGVGYTVAVLDDPASALGALEPPPRGLLEVARVAVNAHFRSAPLPALPALDVPAYGVMVSWHNAADDELRGCLGHVPARASIVSSVATLAVAAATQDPRFDGVQGREIEGLRASVTLVDTPEPISELTGHDPKHWGITVRAGSRHGILLPDLEGVDTAEQQLAITLRKARIAPDEPYALARFRAVTITEGRP